MFTAEMFNSMKKYDDFEYWFMPQGMNSFDVIRKVDDESVGTVNGLNGDIDVDEMHIETIKNCWGWYEANRPEYHVGICHDIDNMTLEEAKTLYETLIVGCAFIRGWKNGVNPDECFKRVNKCLSWLRSGDFYVAPASTIYHESESSGLLHHTLKVINKIHELKYVSSFSKVAIQDAVLVALVHDWCKIGLYERYQRNVKNEETGQWEKVDAYRRMDPPVPLGHGAASLYLVRQYFRLSLEECLAIRWHMGEYNVAPNEMNELHYANEQYPLVQMIQFADRLSIANY